LSTSASLPPAIFLFHPTSSPLRLHPSISGWYFVFSFFSFSPSLLLYLYQVFTQPLPCHFSVSLTPSLLSVSPLCLSSCLFSLLLYIAQNYYRNNHDIFLYTK
jgi:hypothetical protein